MSLSREIVERVRGNGNDLPTDVVNVAKLHLLDAIGVGFAAAASSAGRPYAVYADSLPGDGPCSVFGQTRGFAAPDAALINGGLIHSLEFDDTHTGSIVHGSSVLAATALAVGAVSGASGAAVIGAYAGWYEILVRMGLAAAGKFQHRGFQFTSVGGTLCAAGLAADLSGMETTATLAALGIALSQASGVFEFLSNGSTVKSLHPGWAAHSGINACALARAGLTGPETAIEGRFGLFSAFAGDQGAADCLRERMKTFGSDWHLCDVAFKFHPCCHYLHPFIEAAGHLADDGIRAEMIEAIECRVPAGAAGIICEPWENKQAASGHAMRWSLPGVIAARLADGNVDMATFEHALSDEARSLCCRIQWAVMQEADFPTRFEAEIRCRLNDGSERRVRVDDAYGNKSRPAHKDAVRQKFQSNLAAFEDGAVADRIMEAIEDLDAASDLQGLDTALRCATVH